MVGGKVKASGFAGDDPWQSQCELTSIDGSLVGTVRPVKKGDEVLLTRFGREGLSAESRGKFECYKWMSGELTQELQAAIELSLERRDLHLVALDDASKAIGYFRRADNAADMSRRPPRLRRGYPAETRRDDAAAGT